jgi:microcystin-dependent protein
MGGQIGGTLGEKAGEQAHTLNISELTTHTHFAQASKNNGDNVIPTDNVLAGAAGLYGPAASLTTLQPATITNVGGSQAHLNMQPYLALTFCIALQGIFPSQT